MSDISSPLASSPEAPTPLEILQDSIDQTLSQIQTLITRRAVLTTSLLSSSATRSLQSTSPALSKTLKTHETRALTKSYRLCSSATLFESHDPSPRAPDNGRVLGIRVEIFSSQNGVKKFLTPAYVMLHKPVPGSEELRVLRHTISQAIPIQDLISRYLPSSSKNSMSDDGYAQKKKEQDIPSFVRALRKELVALQRRKDALKRLVNARGVKAVKALDAEERYWKVEWQEGGFARLNVSNKGEVEEVVSVMENGSRDRKRERRLRGVGRVEGLVDAV